MAWMPLNPEWLKLGPVQAYSNWIWARTGGGGVASAVIDFAVVIASVTVWQQSQRVHMTIGVAASPSSLASCGSICYMYYHNVTWPGGGLGTLDPSKARTFPIICNRPLHKHEFPFEKFSLRPRYICSDKSDSHDKCAIVLRILEFPRNKLIFEYMSASYKTIWQKWMSFSDIWSDIFRFVAWTMAKIPKPDKIYPEMTNGSPFWSSSHQVKNLRGCDGWFWEKMNKISKIRIFS